MRLRGEAQKPVFTGISFRQTHSSLLLLRRIATAGWRKQEEQGGGKVREKPLFHQGSKVVGREHERLHAAEKQRKQRKG